MNLPKKILGRHIGDDDSRTKEAEQIEKIRAEIGDLESCLNGLVEQRINGELSKEDFSAKKTEYEAKITNLSSTLKELMKVNTEKEKKKKDLSSRVNALIDSFKSELRHIDEDDYEIPDHIIDAFVERIVVHEDHFDWYLRWGKEDCIGCRMKGTRKSNAETEFLPSFYYSPHGQLLSRLNKE